MRKSILLLITIGLAVVGFKSPSSSKFQYRYQVIANSNSVSDLYDLYEYKERLIDTYEKLLLTVDDNYRQEYLTKRISSFNYKDAVTRYVNGVIVQIIGDGLGRNVSGSLRVSECDMEPVREKFFIFELFN